MAAHQALESAGAGYLGNKHQHAETGSVCALPEREEAVERVPAEGLVRTGGYDEGVRGAGV